MPSFTITALNKDSILCNVTVFVEARINNKISAGKEDIIKHSTERLKEILTEAIQKKMGGHDVKTSQTNTGEHFITPTLFDENL